MEPGPAPHDRLLREFLADRDVRCPGCEYNLRGLTGEQCPECGHAIELDVRRDETALQWRRWLAPAFAWAVMFLVSYGLNALLPWSSGPRNMQALEIMSVVNTIWGWSTGLIGTVALGALVARAGPRWSRRARRRFLALAWVLVGGWLLTTLLWRIAFLL